MHSTAPSDEPVDLTTLPPPPKLRLWGLGEVVLGAIFVIGLSGLAAIAILLTTDASYISDFIATGGGLPSLPPAVLLSLALSSGASLLTWPVLVSFWKGTRSPTRDFGLRFQWRDLLLGPAIAAAGLAVDFIVVQIVFARFLGLEDATNTSTLPIDSLGPLQLAAFVVLVAGLTPVAEETFFRGMALPAAQRRFPGWIGLSLQAALFSVLHFGGAEGAALLATFAVTFIYGLGFGWVRNRTGRLGPTIIAHGLVNAAAVAWVVVTS